MTTFTATLMLKSHFYFGYTTPHPSSIFMRIFVIFENNANLAIITVVLVDAGNQLNG